MKKLIPEDFVKLLLQNAIIPTHTRPIAEVPSPIVHKVIPTVFKICREEGRKQAGLA